MLAPQPRGVDGLLGASHHPCPERDDRYSQRPATIPPTMHVARSASLPCWPIESARRASEGHPGTSRHLRRPSEILDGGAADRLGGELCGGSTITRCQRTRRYGRRPSPTNGMPWSRRTPFRTDDQIGHLWWLLVVCIATTPRECLPSPRTEADEHAGDASLPPRQSHCNGLDAHRPDQPVSGGEMYQSKCLRLCVLLWLRVGACGLTGGGKVAEFVWVEHRPNRLDVVVIDVERHHRDDCAG